MSLQNNLLNSDFLRSNILKPTLESLNKLFISGSVPWIIQKNKSMAIRTAIALLFIYFIRERIFKPPRNIRHIPYFGYFSLIKSLIKGESLFDRGYKTHVPFIDSRPNGLFAEPGNAGWAIHLSNPDDIKHVLSKGELFPKVDFRKNNKSTLLNKFTGGPNVLVLSGEHWKSQRKVISPAFRRSAPIKLFGEITLTLFSTIETLGGTVEVADLMSRCTLDAIGRAGFGFDFAAITDINNYWANLYYQIVDGCRDITFFMFPVLDQRFLWLFPSRRILHEKLDIFLEKLDEVIQSKRNLLSLGQFQNENLEENERDLLTLMIESENRGEGALTNEELKSNLCLFFFAGHDTTASAISFAIYYLAKYPEIQEKARKEVIDILGDDSTDIIPSFEEIKQMKYIDQIMKETARITNPAPRLASRVVVEDTILSGTFIPKGSVLTINAYNTHHSEKNWSDPNTFNPDRFVNNETNPAWIPFGGGPRQCIGLNFSLNEQRVIISMLLRKYVWSFPEGSSDDLKVSGMVVVGPKELNMTFKKRY